MSNVVQFEPAWRDRLQISSTGAIKNNIFNAITAMRGLKVVSDHVHWDDFRGRILITGAMPWHEAGPDRTWSEFDDIWFTEYLQAHGIPITMDIAQRAVVACAMKHRRNCLVEWLQSLQWDGQCRIDNWLTYHLGVEWSPYVSAVGKSWLISAVARAMNPGCKADHVLILEGHQGIGKSTAMRMLAGNEYFTDELGDFGSKDAALQMQGAWIVEIAELDGMSRSAVERTKAFLTRPVDRYRPPYGRHVVDQPRQCVFVGTSNNVELRDTTGNRRFWPVIVTHTDIQGIALEREQLWAEAVQCFCNGDPWWLTDDEVKSTALEEQARRVVSDPWDPILSEWLSGKEKTTVQELLSNALRLSTDRWTRADEMRVSGYLKKAGWERKRVTGNGKRDWVYVRKIH